MSQEAFTGLSTNTNFLHRVEGNSISSSMVDNADYPNFRLLKTQIKIAHSTILSTYFHHTENVEYIHIGNLNKIYFHIHTTI